MDWKSLAESVAKLGLPLLGAVLPVPGGAAIGAALAAAIGAKSGSPGDILASLTASADALQKAKEFEATHQEKMLQIILDAQNRALEAVNKTLQTEAMGGSWLQRNHHALESLATVAAIISIYFVLPLAGKAVPAIPESAFLMLGAILGVTAWQRGQANTAVVKAQ